MMKKVMKIMNSLRTISDYVMFVLLVYLFTQYSEVWPDWMSDVASWALVGVMFINGIRPVMVMITELKSMITDAFQSVKRRLATMKVR